MNSDLFWNDGLYSLLVTQVWQVTVLFVIVLLAIRLFGRNRPHLAHVLWALVLIKCVTPPVFSSQLSPFSWVASGGAATVEHVAPPEQRLSPGPPEIVTAPREAFIPLGNHRSEAARTRQLPDTNRVKQVREFIQAPFNRPAEIPNPVTPSRPLLRTWIPVVWLLGAVICMVWLSLRLVGFLASVNRMSRRSSARVERIANELRMSLGIRRRVTPVVVDALIGPAVVGLIRPKILLPAAIVDSRSDQQLRLLIAHELIHIRRGDLWWAVLQTVGGSLFWFHPLVRFAVRMVSLESERSCDEETVSSLGCRPSDYARNLLEILELKYRLRTAPALPGVRPVEITTDRLERVMKLGQGCYKRNPLWTWIVLLICGTVFLPGAALVFGQDGERVQRPNVDEQTAADSSVRSLAVYDVSDLLTREVNPGKTAADRAQYLVRHFVLQSDLSTSRDPGLQLPTRGEIGPQTLSSLPCLMVVDANGQTLALGGSEPAIKVSGDRMYVYASGQDHVQTAAMLEELRRFGMKQIVVEVRLMNGIDSVADELDWTEGAGMVADALLAQAAHLSAIGSLQHGRTGESRVIESRVDPAGFEDSAAVGPGAPESVTRFVNPADWVDTQADNDSGELQLFADSNRSTRGSTCVVDKDEFESFVEKAAGIAQSNTLQIPTVTTLSGLPATVSDGVYIPFVTNVISTGADPEDCGTAVPEYSVVFQGATISMRPELTGPETVRLNCALGLSEIADVQTFSFDAGTEEDDEHVVTVQVPVVAADRIETEAVLKSGQSLIVRTRSPQTKTNCEQDSGDVYVMVTVHLIDACDVDVSELASPDAEPGGVRDLSGLPLVTTDDRGQQVRYSPATDFGRVRTGEELVEYNRAVAEFVRLCSEFELEVTPGELDAFIDSTASTLGLEASQLVESLAAGSALPEGRIRQLMLERLLMNKLQQEISGREFDSLVVLRADFDRKLQSLRDAEELQEFFVVSIGDGEDRAEDRRKNPGSTIEVGFARIRLCTEARITTNENSTCIEGENLAVLAENGFTVFRSERFEAELNHGDDQSWSVHLTGNAVFSSGVGDGVVTADSISIHSGASGNGQMIAAGNVEFQHEEVSMVADRIELSFEQGSIRLTGAARIEIREEDLDPEVYTGNNIVWDTNTEEITVVDQ